MNASPEWKRPMKPPAYDAEDGPLSLPEWNEILMVIFFVTRPTNPHITDHSTRAWTEHFSIWMLPVSSVLAPAVIAPANSPLK